MPDTPEWLYNQSAVVPYRLDDGVIEVMLITSRSGKRWVLPKGVIDPGESAPESAAREALEEAGITGAVEITPVGRYTYEKWGGTCSVEVFLMEVHRELDDWDEADIRSRQWYHHAEAASMVDEPQLQRILMNLPVQLADPLG